MSPNHIWNDKVDIQDKAIFEYSRPEVMYMLAGCSVTLPLIGLIMIYIYYKGYCKKRKTMQSRIEASLSDQEMNRISMYIGDPANDLLEISSPKEGTTEEHAINNGVDITSTSREDSNSLTLLECQTHEFVQGGEDDICICSDAAYANVSSNTEVPSSTESKGVVDNVVCKSSIAVDGGVNYEEDMESSESDMDYFESKNEEGKFQSSLEVEVTTNEALSNANSENTQTPSKVVTGQFVESYDKDNSNIECFSVAGNIAYTSVNTKETEHLIYTDIVEENIRSLLDDYKRTTVGCEGIITNRDLNVGKNETSHKEANALPHSIHNENLHKTREINHRLETRHTCLQKDDDEINTIKEGSTSSQNDYVTINSQKPGKEDYAKTAHHYVTIKSQKGTVEKCIIEKYREPSDGEYMSMSPQSLLNPQQSVLEDYVTMYPYTSQESRDEDYEMIDYEQDVSESSRNTRIHLGSHFEATVIRLSESPIRDRYHNLNPASVNKRAETIMTETNNLDVYYDYRDDESHYEDMKSFSHHIDKNTSTTFETVYEQMEDTHDATKTF